MRPSWGFRGFFCQRPPLHPHPHPHPHSGQLPRACPSPAAAALHPSNPSNPTPWPAPPPDQGLRVANGHCQSPRAEPRGPAGAAPAALELGHFGQRPARLRLSHVLQLRFLASPPPARTHPALCPKPRGRNARLGDPVTVAPRGPSRSLPAQESGHLGPRSLLWHYQLRDLGQ